VVLKKFTGVLVYLFFILFISGTQELFAGLSNEQLTQAVIANPKLLSDPKINEMLKLKSQQGSSTDIKNNEELKVENNITTFEDLSKNENDKNETTSDLNKFDAFKSPLEVPDLNKLFKNLEKQQIKEDFVKLKRYGDEFFLNRNRVNLSSLPVPENYQLVPEDEVSITLYGPRNDNWKLTIDNEGRIVIPGVGPLTVAGLTFKEAKSLISDTITKAYPNTGVLVNVTGFATIQVILSGEVDAPGVYNIRSFSTVKDALIAAHGISENGSMRDVVVKRNNQIIKHIDFYKLMRYGDKSQEILLKAGDVIVVKPVKSLVTLAGYVKHPAIFEVKRGETLGELIKLAGGLKANASRYGIKIKRHENFKNIKIISLKLSEANRVKLKDGDKIYIYDLDEANIQKVTLYGNVVKPGSLGLPKEGMTFYELFAPIVKEKGLRGVFLKDTLFDYAVILRITPDLEEKLIGFNLKSALEGKVSIPLYSRDEIYIFNSLAVMPADSIKVNGECVKNSSPLRYVNGMTLNDAITTVGLKCSIDKEHIRITSYDPVTSQPSTKVVNLLKENNYKLQPKDEIFTYSALATNPPKTAYIKGEVYKPGKYPINDNTTVKELILAAGGLTDRAGNKVEIVHYIVEDGKRKRVIEHSIKSLIMSEKSPKVKNYDEITIFKIPYWSEKKTVTIKGQVLYPGTYPIEDGDKLADLIKRAGGFTSNAFIEGAVFTRKDIKKMQEKGLEREVKELEKRITYIAASPSQVGENSSDKQMLISLLDNLKEEIKDINMTGRIVVKLDKDIDEFSKSPYNIILKDGDTLYVPSQEDSVVVLGEVLNPSAQIYNPEYTFSDYIERCGGLKESAGTDTIYVIHANGEAEKIETGYFFASNVKIQKGDTIVVPMKIDTISNIQLAKDITSIFYQLAVSAAALKTIGSL